MLNKAKQNAGDLNDKIKFRRMDAHNLEFDEGQFDLIVTRNLTWNLKDPEKAYKSWYKVLRKGGKMINFDANWYLHLFDEEKRNILCDLIKKKSISRQQISRYAPLFPDKTMRNLIESEIIYYVAQ